ncbi:M20 family peptidase [Ottowia thiooxydans]|uniref:M20 family peptidase n=1 Tax=Ottowia thiooxydans TaxID=219182 RepID=UPI00048A4537|nr:M20 family peptidase [Ottowia thiooxydans]
MVKKAILSFALLIAALVVAVAVNTWRQGSRQVSVPPAPALTIDTDAAAGRLAVAIKFKTISSLEDSNLNADQFTALHAHLQASYPRAHAALKRELVGGLTLLYTWPGTDPSAPPVLLLAHQDVVPIAPSTEAKWQASPFAGEIKEGYVWGRGAWDNKANLIGQMEAVEMLLAEGFKPRQTIYLAMGADEEVGGLRGAKKVAELLASRGVKLDFVLDEGLLITEGILKGLSKPAALIGIAEKGYLSVEMHTHGTPGHSSMPPPAGTGAIGMLSSALTRLEDKQMPAHIRGVAQEMFDTIAPEMDGFGRVALSNLWLFGPLVQRQLEGAASTNAMLRTTTAPTIFEAGNKDNVIPGEAKATVNFRLLPGDTQESVLKHVRDAVGGQPEGRFELKTLKGASEPSPISPTASASYQLLNRTLRSLFPDTLVAPGLMIAATDSRHFTEVSQHIYRFSPVRAKPEDLARFHGTNERVSIANFGELIRFYVQLLRNTSLPASTNP